MDLDKQNSFIKNTRKILTKLKKHTRKILTKLKKNLWNSGTQEQSLSNILCINISLI